HIAVPFATHDIRNISSPYSTYFPKAANSESMRINDYPKFIYNSNAARSLQRLIDQEHPFNLAHLHIYYGRLTASILPVLKKAGIPIVQSLHEYKLACPIYTLERRGKTCKSCVTGSSLN